MCPIVVVVGVAQVETLACKHRLNSMSDLVSKFGIESSTTNQICPSWKPHRPTRRKSDLVAIPK